MSPSPLAKLAALGAAWWNACRIPGAIVFALGLGVRLWLIQAYPIIFGGDSIVRLANQDRVLLAYQLPLLQGGIHLLSLLSAEVIWVRYAMAIVGALAGVAFYFMAAKPLGREAGFAAALFFATNPFVLAYSIVPYQEILMLAVLFAAFGFLFGRRWLLAAVFLALACWTRYEAWAACPVFAWSYFVESKGESERESRGGRGIESGFDSVKNAAKAVRAALLFFAAPAVWFVYHSGIAPQGTMVVDVSLSLERFARYAYLGWITVKNTPAPELALASFGAWVCWRRRLYRVREYRLAAAFVALFLVAVLFSAHGERDQPERFVTAREAHILLAGACFLAALGWRELKRFRGAALALSLAVGLVMADRFAARETSDPRLRLAYRLAQRIDALLEAGERVVVLAPPIPAESMARYLDKNERRSGSEGRRAALRNLASLDVGPPDYQRTLVHSRWGRERIQNISALPLSAEDADFLDSLKAKAGLARAETGVPEWLAVWSDFEATSERERRLEALAADGAALEVLKEGTEGAIAVSLYRLGG